MSRDIVVNSSQRVYTYRINDLPDQCPVCHVASEFNLVHSYSNRDELHDDPSYKDTIQIVFQCPRHRCRYLFIAIYKIHKGTSGEMNFLTLYPKSTKPKKFSKTIYNISPAFIRIYNQALQAEDNGLEEVYGPTYRRALEFLVKDYITGNLLTEPEQYEQVLKETSLQKLINRYFSDNPNLKQVAERAWWLGNDLTHYLQKWEGKDINDLKKIIHITVNWLEIVVESQQIIEEMPA